MEGGLFGLSNEQKIYLYFAQLMPTIIVLFTADLIDSLFLTQIFYVVSSYVYIRFLSIEKSYYPYIINETNKARWQIQKGLVLGFSAFLLITIYGILFLKIGRVVVPKSVDLGDRFHHSEWLFIVLCITNPILEEWFWRLFLPKTFQSTYYRSHVTNFAYLLYHLVLFSRYVGFFRALPLVGTFFSVGRSMSHIKSKYGIFSSIVAHYGISLGALSLYLYLKATSEMII